MCISCVLEYADGTDRHAIPPVTPLMVATADAIKKLYELPSCSTGGPLHVATDDTNIEDGILEFCVGAIFDRPGQRSQGWWRVEQTDAENRRMEQLGVLILRALVSMPLLERAMTVNRYALTRVGAWQPFAFN